MEGAVMSLDNVNMRDLFISKVLTDFDEALLWCQSHRLIASTRACGKCGTAMVIGRKSSSNEGYLWRCPVKGCRFTTSLRKGSFFEKSNLRLTQLIQLVYLWARDASQYGICHEVRISRKTCTDWCAFLREICSEDLMQSFVPIGGKGHVVAISEILVTRPKTGSKAPARRIETQWVFGGVDLSTKDFFIQVVRKRDADTLIPIIRKKVLPRTTIWSNELEAYSNLSKMKYYHLTKSNAPEKVTPAGIDGNYIEILWGNAKKRWNRMNGVDHTLMSSYVDEWVWRRKREKEHAFRDLIEAIANNPLYRVET